MFNMDSETKSEFNNPHKTLIVPFVLLKSTKTYGKLTVQNNAFTQPSTSKNKNSDPFPCPPLKDFMTTYFSSILIVKSLLTLQMVLNTDVTDKTSKQL